MRKENNFAEKESSSSQILLLGHYNMRAAYLDRVKVYDDVLELFHHVLQRLANANVVGSHGGVRGDSGDVEGSSRAWLVFHRALSNFGDRQGPSQYFCPTFGFLGFWYPWEKY